MNDGNDEKRESFQFMDEIFVNVGPHSRLWSSSFLPQPVLAFRKLYLSVGGLFGTFELFSSPPPSFLHLLYEENSSAASELR